jgi:deoxyribonuclease V
MRFPRLHAWPRSVRAAIALQNELAAGVRLTPVITPPRLAAGCDAAFSPDGEHVIAGVVVLDAGSGVLVEQVVARRPCRFPYVPGLLSFRELPAVLAAFRRLRSRPDAVLCDAQGLAHPRGLGLACHLGLWLNLATVGCAKSRLCGEFQPPGELRGGRSALRLNDREVGAVLRTRSRVAPLFVSPGHLCDVDSAAALTLQWATRYRLPEPTRRAHQLVTAARHPRPLS